MKHRSKVKRQMSKVEGQTSKVEGRFYFSDFGLSTLDFTPSSTTFILKIIKKVYQTSQLIVFIDLIISELECRD